SFREECHLAETLLQCVIVKDRVLEDFLVRKEGDLRTCPVRLALAHDLQLVHYFSALIALFIDLSLVVDLHFKPLRQRVYDGSSHAVQTAGDLVSPASEFSARMEDREHDFHCRKSRFMIDSHGDSTSVIADSD